MKTKVNLSFDGIQKAHDAFRKDINGNETHKKILDNIRYIKNKKNYCINFCLHPSQVSHLYNSFCFIEKIGFSDIKFIPLFEYNWEKYILLNYIKELIKINNSNSLFFINTLKESVSAENITCEQHMETKVSIYTDGTIFPCSVWVSKNYDATLKFESSGIFGYTQYLKDLKENTFIQSKAKIEPICQSTYGNTYKKQKILVEALTKKMIYG